MDGYIFETDLSDTEKWRLKNMLFTPNEVVIPVSGTELSHKERAVTVRNVIVDAQKCVHYEFFECEGRFPHYHFDSSDPGFYVSGVIASFKGNLYVVGLSEDFGRGLKSTDALRTGVVHEIGNRVSGRILAREYMGYAMQLEDNVKTVGGYFGTFRIAEDEAGTFHLADMHDLSNITPEDVFATTEAIVRHMGIGLGGQEPEGSLRADVTGVLSEVDGELRLVVLSGREDEFGDEGEVFTIGRGEIDRFDALCAIDPSDTFSRMVGRFDLAKRTDGTYEVLEVDWIGELDELDVEEIDRKASAAASSFVRAM